MFVAKNPTLFLNILSIIVVTGLLRSSVFFIQYILINIAMVL